MGGLEWNHGVEWSGVDLSGVCMMMECIAVECNGMDRWNAMQWSGMEWSRWMLRMDDPDPKCPRKKNLGFFGQSDNFHFSKVAHFFSFCEALSKMVSKKRRATKLAFFENCVLTAFFLNDVLCVF